MAHSIACYLWDYLRRSGASGYFLPLSGGADSAATACGVYYMCHKVFNTIAANDDQSLKTLQDLRNILKIQTYTPTSAEDLMRSIFYTAYLGSPNSSQDSRQRAQHLSERLGNSHYEVEIDEIFQAFRNCIKPVFKREPQFQVQGGTLAEDLALQNI